MLKTGGGRPRLAKKTSRVEESAVAEAGGPPEPSEEGSDSAPFTDGDGEEPASPVTEMGGSRPPKARAARRPKRIHTTAYLIAAVEDVLRLPRNTDWVDVKVSGAAPVDIGESISALSNTAALEGKPHAYVVWGINEGTRLPVGTSFVPGAANVNHEELDSWLIRHLNPRVEFGFHDVEFKGKRIVLLEIDAATERAVQFQGHALIRMGSARQLLKDFPESERALQRMFEKPLFERSLAMENISADEVLARLDFDFFFSSFKRAVPESPAEILAALAAESLIARGLDDHWNVTHLGAILFAKRLGDFAALSNKTVQVTAYTGEGRGKVRGEFVSSVGYAIGFQRLVDEVTALLPLREADANASNTAGAMFAGGAIREVIANALAHQDFERSDAGPSIEIFKDRVEITNPGTPLIETDRFVDAPSQSRNEAVSSFMRRVAGLAEAGAGVDRIVAETESAFLPAPTFASTGDETRVVMYGPRSLARMDKADRVHAVYLHTCLRFANRDTTNITSVRERFAVKAENTVSAARYISDALDAKVIRLAEPSAAQKLRRYVPYWA